MKLIHYSELGIDFDPVYRYSGAATRYTHKPDGLWLSVGEAWKEWCKREGFREKRLKRPTEFVVNDWSKLYHLRGNKLEEILKFESKYRLLSADVFSHIDWKRVSRDWSGILVHPYTSPFHFSAGAVSHRMWLAGWDCSSACVWDLEVLR